MNYYHYGSHDWSKNRSSAPSAAFSWVVRLCCQLDLLDFDSLVQTSRLPAVPLELLWTTDPPNSVVTYRLSVDDHLKTIRVP